MLPPSSVKIVSWKVFCTAVIIQLRANIRIFATVRVIAQWRARGTSPNRPKRAHTPFRNCTRMATARAGPSSVQRSAAPRCWWRVWHLTLTCGWCGACLALGVNPIAHMHTCAANASACTFCSFQRAVHCFTMHSDPSVKMQQQRLSRYSIFFAIARPRYPNPLFSQREFGERIEYVPGQCFRQGDDFPMTPSYELMCGGVMRSGGITFRAVLQPRSLCI